jgi:hypothetical protein
MRKERALFISQSQSPINLNRPYRFERFRPWVRLERLNEQFVLSISLNH